MSSTGPDNNKSFFANLEREWESLQSNLRIEWDSLRSNLNDPNHWNNTIRAESSEVTDFYLSPDQREQLKNMKPIKAVFYRTGWVFRAMFEKLRPERRVISIIGVLLILFANQNNTYDIVGGLFLIFVILLELKDKLVAHDELEEGRHIQELLMPERLPKLDGWSAWLYTRSANEVCGDLIDFLRMNDGRIGLAIADVAGKGLHAALLTTKLQATFRALAFEQQPLSQLVEKVNTIFHRDSPSHLFASLFYIEFNEHDSSLRFVNAGHLPALIRKNGVVEETGKGDLALGLLRHARYTEQFSELQTGDVIILYSDGLTEAKNAAGDFFGKDRLISIMRTASGTSEEIGLSVISAADRFIGTTKASDDLSIIILQRL